MSLKQWIENPLPAAVVSQYLEYPMPSHVSCIRMQHGEEPTPVLSFVFSFCASRVLIDDSDINRAVSIAGISLFCSRLPSLVPSSAIPRLHIC